MRPTHSQLLLLRGFLPKPGLFGSSLMAHQHQTLAQRVQANHWLVACLLQPDPYLYQMFLLEMAQHMTRYRIFREHTLACHLYSCFCLDESKQQALYEISCLIVGSCLLAKSCPLSFSFSCPLQLSPAKRHALWRYPSMILEYHLATSCFQMQIYLTFFL